MHTYVGWAINITHTKGILCHICSYIDTNTNKQCTAPATQTVNSVGYQYWRLCNEYSAYNMNVLLLPVHFLAHDAVYGMHKCWGCLVCLARDSTLSVITSDTRRYTQLQEQIAREANHDLTWRVNVTRGSFSDRGCWGLGERGEGMWGEVGVWVDLTCRLIPLLRTVRHVKYFRATVHAAMAITAAERTTGQNRHQENWWIYSHFTGGLLVEFFCVALL